MPGNTPREGRFELGDFELQSGQVLPDAHLGFTAYGELNEARDNVIVYPTWYTGTHHNNDPFIGTGKALDPARYLIVVPDMFTQRPVHVAEQLRPAVRRDELPAGHTVRQRGCTIPSLD